MKKSIHICAFAIIILMLPTILIAQINTSDSLSYYSEKYDLILDYNGIEGHSLGIEFGKRKTCFDCKKQHRKFWGGGFEFARSVNQVWYFGPRFSWQRGSDQFAIRFTAIAFTSTFHELIAVLRPEFLFYPTKKHNWSLGVHFNVNRDLLENRNYVDFGVLGMSARYEFALKQ